MSERVQGVLEFQTRGMEALEASNQKLDDITRTSRWTALASGITATIGVVQTLQAVVGSAARTVGALAMEAAADIDAFTRLDRTLSRFGVNGTAAVTGVHESIEALRRSTAGFGDEALALGLDRFILQVGDAEKAVANYSLVVDTAARLTGGDLASAAKIVAFALEGEFMQLSRLLPEVKAFARDHSELAGTTEGAAFAIRTLRDLVGGGAAEDRSSLTGAIAGLRDEWGEFRETLGKGLFSSDSVTQVNMMTIAVRDMTAQVERVLNNPALRVFFAPTANAASGLVGLWGRILGIDVSSLRSRATAIDYTNAPLQDVMGAPPGRSGAPPAAGGTAPKIPFWNDEPMRGRTDQRGGLMQVVDVSRDVYAQVASNYAAALGQMESRGDEWVRRHTAQQSAAYGASQALAQSTSVVISRLLLRENVERMRGLSVVKYVAAQTASALIGGIAQYAMTKAAANIAQAFEDLGNPLTVGHAPAAFAAAAKWSALAGVAGGTAAAIGQGSQRDFDRSGATSSAGGASGAGPAAGGVASNGIRALNAAAGPSSVIYNINVTYQGAVVFGDGGTRDWYRRELLPLLRESREMGELAA